MKSRQSETASTILRVLFLPRPIHDLAFGLCTVFTGKRLLCVCPYHVTRYNLLIWGEIQGSGRIGSALSTECCFESGWHSELRTNWVDFAVLQADVLMASICVEKFK
jgi:hypothetical protein